MLKTDCLHGNLILYYGGICFIGNAISYEIKTYSSPDDRRLLPFPSGNCDFFRNLAAASGLSAAADFIQLRNHTVHQHTHG